MYYLYSQKVSEQVTLPEGFSVTQKKMPPFSSIHAMLWTITKGSGFYKIYTLINRKGEKVCYAETLNKCPFLRFLPRNVVHIGPCMTPPEHRGNGYYPLLIKHIASLYRGVDCYMFVHESNIASIKGIEKAGFERIGTCKKFLNFYFQE